MWPRFQCSSVVALKTSECRIALHNFDTDVVRIHYWLYDSQRDPFIASYNGCICAQLIQFEQKMTHICFKSSSTIRAAVSPNESNRRIELTPWDLQMLLVNHIQKGLLFFKPTPSQEEELQGSSVVDHLKTSLSYTLDIVRNTE